MLNPIITISPQRTWQSITLIIVSSFFWMFFLLATLFVGRIAVIQALQNLNRDAILNLGLVACMSVGVFVWALGFIKLIGNRYKIFADAEFLVWREQSFFFIRDRRFMLKSITGIFDSGTPKVGYSLLLEVNGNIHRLGALFSKNDIYQLSRFIEQTKGKFSDVGKQSSASP